MKRALCCLLLTVLLAGCAKQSDGLDRALAIRKKLETAQGCTFRVEISADYGSEVFTFAMDCTADSAGAVQFSVTAPDSIAGITGTLDAEGGRLTFDGQALAFPLLADGQLGPVSAPWLLLQTLRGGYLTSCADLGDGLLLSIDDSYEEGALKLSIALDGADIPVSAEVSWQGRRILTLRVENFTFL